MEKNILLILGHPSGNSFCKAIIGAYQKGNNWLKQVEQLGKGFK